MMIDFLEQTVSGNKDSKDSAGEGSEGSEEHGRENLYCLRDHLNNYKQTIEIQMLKELLMRAQKEVRGSLLFGGRKLSGILSYG